MVNTMSTLVGIPQRNGHSESQPQMELGDFQSREKLWYPAAIWKQRRPRIWTPSLVRNLQPSCMCRSWRSSLKMPLVFLACWVWVCQMGLSLGWTLYWFSQVWQDRNPQHNWGGCATRRSGSIQAMLPSWMVEDGWRPNFKRDQFCRAIWPNPANKLRSVAGAMVSRCFMMFLVWQFANALQLRRPYYEQHFRCLGTAAFEADANVVSDYLQDSLNMS